MEWTFHDVDALLLIECETGGKAERSFDEGEYSDFVRWLGELSEWAESFVGRHEARIARARLVVRNEAGATSDESFVGALDELLAWLEGRTAWAEASSILRSARVRALPTPATVVEFPRGLRRGAQLGSGEGA